MMKTNAGGAVLAAALEYAARGWRVIPVRAGEKRPYLDEWQRAASNDEERVIAWWEAGPDDNVGVVLGEGSDLIDVEADSAEAEELWNEIWRRSGLDHPVTPTFKSVRGKHRLFRWSAELPQAKAVFKIGSLEIRTGNGGKGAQTVFPPSRHPSGVRYEWLIPPSEADVVALPQAVVALLVNMAGEAVTAGDVAGRTGTGLSVERRAEIMAGASEGGRNQALTQLCGSILVHTRDVWSQVAVSQALETVTLWNESRNKPPLPLDEVQRTFESILRAEQRKRATASQAPLAETLSGPGQNAAARTAPAVEAVGGPEWRIVIVESKPRAYRLYAPLWPERYIELSAEQINSPRLIRVEATEQADVAINPQAFDAHWTGKGNNPSLFSQLMAAAEYLPASAESKRDVVVAQALLDALETGKPLSDGKDPPLRGTPWMDDKGCVLFQFIPVWTPMARSDDRIERPELLRLLDSLETTHRQVRQGGRVRRWFVIDQAGMAALRRLCGTDLV